jgi:hypothetical protein
LNQIILQTITAEEWESGENPEAMLIYLGQVYYAFRGEIPHLKHNKTIVSAFFSFSLEWTLNNWIEQDEIEEILVAPRKSVGKSPKKRASLEREPKRQVRKRRSHDAVSFPFLISLF